MDGTLNKSGNLIIIRKGREVYQFCPFVGTMPMIKCGDWCPLFCEPRATGVFNNITHQEYVDLRVCNKQILEFDYFEDLREEE
jgi:hypothetical protein